jgi:S-adenosylmethionine:tRNA ribosyltransferase-isomerase
VTALPVEAVPSLEFAIPSGSEAASTPEDRGLTRDGVRLLVASPAGVQHRTFRDLPQLLRPGDLVVVNTSATLPAALPARGADGSRLPVHVSTRLDDGSWVVEVRRRDGSGPELGLMPGTELTLPAGVRLRLGSAFPRRTRTGTRLWRSSVEPHVDLVPYLARHGRPVRYSYVRSAYPLADYQTVYAGDPGSAEMPSAGRPFTAGVLARLATRGVPVVPVVLHTGLSSPEAHEPPTPERFAVPDVTARLVNGTRDAGGRVVAVGTTVVRALETVTGVDGVTRAGSGWTDLVLGPDRSVRAVGGLVTGLHAPEASHLSLLAAAAGLELVRVAYAEAAAERYRWHEFGDSMLFLP